MPCIYRKSPRSLSALRIPRWAMQRWPPPHNERIREGRCALKDFMGLDASGCDPGSKAGDEATL